jgi:hypothetical protein
VETVHICRRRSSSTLREQILARLDEAASLLTGKNTAALEALQSARMLVASLEA